MENWKDIKGYEGKYQVSNKGNVRSIDRVVVGIDGRKTHFVGKNIFQAKVGSGYMQVALSRKGKPTRKYVHQLVAKAFIPNPLGRTEINHKDYNKQNNCVENLEWCTHLENIIDLRNKRYGGYKNSHGKVKEIINTCVDCGKNISYGSTRCKRCSGKNRRVKARPTKEDLEQVLINYDGNFTSVAKVSGVTTTTIRRWCRYYKISDKSQSYKKDSNI